jgi:hypothetical protein
MISYHAIQRAQERTGLKIKSSESFIANALERGKTVGVFAANERNYLQAKEAKGECRVIVYQSFFFIVDDADLCVTMYAAPKWFGKKKYYDGKTKIKNIKKYMRLYKIFDEVVA